MDVHIPIIGWSAEMNDCTFLSKNNSCMIDGVGWYACFVDEDELRVCREHAADLLTVQIRGVADKIQHRQSLPGIAVCELGFSNQLLVIP